MLNIILVYKPILLCLYGYYCFLLTTKQLLMIVECSVFNLFTYTTALQQVLHTTTVKLDEL